MPKRREQEVIQGLATAAPFRARRRYRDTLWRLGFMRRFKSMGSRLHGSMWQAPIVRALPTFTVGRCREDTVLLRTRSRVSMIARCEPNLFSSIVFGLA